MSEPILPSENRMRIANQLGLTLDLPLHVRVDGVESLYRYRLSVAKLSSHYAACESPSNVLRSTVKSDGELVTP